MAGAAKVTFTDSDQSQTVQSAPSGIGFALGKTQRGVPDVPVEVRNWRTFQRYFGTYLADSDVAYAVKRAVEAGASVWVSRVTHRSGGLTTAIPAGKTFKTTTSIDTFTLFAGQFGDEDPGTWGNDLKVSFAQATRNPSTRFKLTLKYLGTVVDTIDEISMDPADDRYLGKLLSNHPYLTFDDADAYGQVYGGGGTIATYADARPVTQTDTSLVGGSNGGAIVTADLTGDSAAKTGLYAFDARKEPSFGGAPGNTDRTFAAALIAYCAARGDLFAVLDGPVNLTTAQKVTYRQATGAYAGGAAFDSRYGGIWWNRIQITDPLTKTVRYISNMGDVFAAFANAKIGTQVTPAGAHAGSQGGRIRGGSPVAEGLEEEIPIDGDGDTLADYGMNFLTNHATYGLVIWGERNLQSVSSDLDRVPQIRWHIFARQSLKPILDDLLLFQPNDETAWKQSRDKVAPWLRKEIALRAIAAANFVNDATVNDAAAIAAHRQLPQLFVKHNLHAEFIEVALVAVSQDTTIAQ